MISARGFVYRARSVIGTARPFECDRRVWRELPLVSGKLQRDAQAQPRSLLEPTDLLKHVGTRAFLPAAHRALAFSLLDCKGGVDRDLAGGDGVAR